VKKSKFSSVSYSLEDNLNQSGEIHKNLMNNLMGCQNILNYSSAQSKLGGLPLGKMDEEDLFQKMQPWFWWLGFWQNAYPEWNQSLGFSKKRDPRIQSLPKYFMEINIIRHGR
jgi:hypothetical protein